VRAIRATPVGPPSFALRAYWGSITLIMLCLVVNLITLAYRDTGFSFVFLGVGVASQCVILWVGHVARINIIGRRVAAAIWTALILSLLGTTATIYGRTVISPKHVRIEKMLLLDDSEVVVEKAPDGSDHARLKDFKVRSNYDYKVAVSPGGERDVIIAFACVVSDFQRDDFGNIDVEGEAALTGGDNDLKDFGSLRTHRDDRTDEGSIRQMPATQNINLKTIKQVLGPPKDKIWFIHILRKFHIDVLKPGAKELRITIRDKKNYTVTEAVQRIVIRE
jgi:hypothetical protein